MREDCVDSFSIISKEELSCSSTINSLMSSYAAYFKKVANWSNLSMSHETAKTGFFFTKNKYYIHGHPLMVQKRRTHYQNSYRCRLWFRPQILSGQT